MELSDNGLNLIKRFEGFSANIYICAAGWPTIGYGHAIRSKEEEEAFKRAGPLTEAAAVSLLQEDTKKAVRAVISLTHVPLNQNQFDALVSFVFNLGGANYQRSTLRMLINRRDFLAAAKEFPKWSKAAGRELLGLKRRREAEQALFLTPA